jgi:hypothetical protein
MTTHLTSIFYICFTSKPNIRNLAQSRHDSQTDTSFSASFLLHTRIDQHLLLVHSLGYPHRLQQLMRLSFLPIGDLRGNRIRGLGGIRRLSISGIGGVGVWGGGAGLGGLRVRQVRYPACQRSMKWRLTLRGALLGWDANGANLTSKLSVP